MAKWADPTLSLLSDGGLGIDWRQRWSAMRFERWRNSAGEFVWRAKFPRLLQPWPLPLPPSMPANAISYSSRWFRPVASSRWSWTEASAGEGGSGADLPGYMSALPVTIAVAAIGMYEHVCAQDGHQRALPA